MTEYRKNDKGIWLPLDASNLENNKKEVPNIRKPVFNIMGGITKVTAFFTIISILVGNFNIYNYLKHINYDFLFPDIISNTSSAIAILLMYSLFILTLMLGFLSPFLLNAFISYKGYKNLSREYLYNLYKVSLMFAFCNIVIFALYLKFDFDYKYIAGMFSFVFMFSAIEVFIQRKDNILTILLLSFIIPTPTFIYFIFVFLPTITTTNNGSIHWSFFTISAFLFLHNFIASYICLTRKQYVDLLASLLFVLIIIYNFFLSIFQDYSISLHKPRFIEKPKNSSWYIIHNGNTISETINGMTKDEIKYRQQFFIPNGWRQYCKDDVFNGINMQNCPTLRNENVLYGYMAWNLGNTKVFCPQSVDFFDDKGNNKEKSEKCLVIDGKYLQPVSEYYLKQPME